MLRYAPQAKLSEGILRPSTSTPNRVPGRKSGLAASLLHLQRTMGNQVVLRLLSPARGQRLQRSYVVSGPVAGERWSVPEPAVERTAPRVEATEIQRQPQGGGSGSNQPSGQSPPALAAPSLTLTPGNTLTRGDTLTAKVDFTPTAGEKLNVTGWRFTSPAGDVTRPAKDATFQKEWKGLMALSGTLELNYEVKPKGKKAVAGTPVPMPVTVNARSGVNWTTTITDLAEVPLTGGFSPPQRAESLGQHAVPGDYPPAAQDNKIAGGPNSGFTFVELVTDRKFESQPRIHPDVTDATSAFRRFHQEAGRLYFVPRAGARILIPPREYRVRSATPGAPMTFDPVGGWTAFYKRHRVYTVTFTSDGKSVVAQDNWWTLNPDAERGQLEITNEDAVRRALDVGARAPINGVSAANGDWDSIVLMPSAKILPGTRSHEYVHAVHSHRANLHKIVRALDPRQILEAEVSTPQTPIVFGDVIHHLMDEIQKPSHEIVDEAASRAARKFMPAAGMKMAAVNQDPASGAVLGALWDITNDRPLPP